MNQYNYPLQSFNKDTFSDQLFEMQVLKLLAANFLKKIVNKIFKAYRSNSLQTLNNDYTKQQAVDRPRKNRKQYQVKSQVLYHDFSERC